ncbi:hypothetical protein ACFQZF_01405 [Flavobacterium myungsuense]|uniref:hypothetical protein n=1 Tax=Flavobacterium myungsuense TaxID=651823 RepID=UPI003635BE60
MSNLKPFRLSSLNLPPVTVFFENGHFKTLLANRIANASPAIPAPIIPTDFVIIISKIQLLK